MVGIQLAMKTCGSNITCIFASGTGVSQDCTLLTLRVWPLTSFGNPFGHRIMKTEIFGEKMMTTVSVHKQNDMQP